MIRRTVSRFLFSFKPQARQLSTSQQYPRINAQRLYDTIHETCQWGNAHRYGEAATETGMARLTLSDSDKLARDWLVREVTDLGCTVKIDSMGNTFARRAGSGATGKPMIAMGSHLDTQPYGGRYDGILGIVAGLEVLRTLKETGISTNHDLGLVNWTNEEGARFPKSMCASGVWAGKIPEQEAWDLRDVSDPSITMLSELKRIGYHGDTKCSHTVDGVPLGAHFELHIEQGPILEAGDKNIGVVLGSQAYRWLTINITGRAAHTGTTPFVARQDPVLAASSMICAATRIAKNHNALASTGIIDLPKPWSVNSLAPSVRFTLDIRHPDTDVVTQVQALCLEEFSRIAKTEGGGAKLDWSLDFESKATKFDEKCVGAIRAVAEQEVGADKVIDITSGAGHDSVYTSSICPSAMIFIPCKDGVSHHPTEFSTMEQCATGAQVLLDAVLLYDEQTS